MYIRPVYCKVNHEDWNMQH